MPTAGHRVGIRSPQRCVSFAEGKGEHREPRGVGKFRQEFYRNPNPSPNFFSVRNFIETEFPSLRHKMLKYKYDFN